MAAPVINRVTFSKLLSIHRATGLVLTRPYRLPRNPNADRKPEQEERLRPEKIDETEGTWKSFTDLQYWRKERLQRRHGQGFNETLVDDMLSEIHITKSSVDNMPVKMVDPYQKPYKKCLICRENIELDYKNVQLLSQFVSPYTGRIYGRHVTGLCNPMQKRVASLIIKAQKTLLMPKLRKTPEYLDDPKLFNLAPKPFTYGQ